MELITANNSEMHGRVWTISIANPRQVIETLLSAFVCSN